MLPLPSRPQKPSLLITHSQRWGRAGVGEAWVWLAILAATLFRALPLLTNRFHPDEALYASFGRLIASGRDGLLAQTLVDKPPLMFYLLAGSFSLLGGNEFAARLPSLLADVISVALLFALTCTLYNRPTARLAAWFYALSPFAISFAVTTFMDPLLTMFGLWSLLCAARGRLGWSAFALALSFATKQTALIFLPLALAFYFLRFPPLSLSSAFKQFFRAAFPFFLTLTLTALLIFTWDALRLQYGAPVSFWEQGYADNAPNRLARSGEVYLRALGWLELLSYITASAPLNLIFVIGLPLLLFTSLRKPSAHSITDFLFSTYLLLYLSVYWLLPFSVWDRYLVPIVPFILILFASLTEYVIGYRLLPVSRITLHVLRFTLLALLLPSALLASQSRYPIGGDKGAYLGLEDAARYLNQLPYETVLYDFWLSWQWNFYLFDSKVYVAWMPNPAALETDLRSFGRTSPRYLTVPSWESDVEIRTAAAQTGFTLTPVHTSLRPDGSQAFIIYQLVPNP